MVSNKFIVYCMFALANWQEKVKVLSSFVKQTLLNSKVSSLKYHKTEYFLVTSFVISVGYVTISLL